MVIFGQKQFAEWFLGFLGSILWFYGKNGGFGGLPISLLEKDIKESGAAGKRHLNFWGGFPRICWEKDLKQSKNNGFGSYVADYRNYVSKLLQFCVSPQERKNTIFGVLFFRSCGNTGIFNKK